MGDRYPTSFEATSEISHAVGMIVKDLLPMIAWSGEMPSPALRNAMNVGLINAGATHEEAKAIVIKVWSSLALARESMREARAALMAIQNRIAWYEAEVVGRTRAKSAGAVTNGIKVS